VNDCQITAATAAADIWLGNFAALLAVVGACNTHT